MPEYKDFSNVYDGMFYMSVTLPHEDLMEIKLLEAPCETLDAIELRVGGLTIFRWTAAELAELPLGTNLVGRRLIGGAGPHGPALPVGTVFGHNIHLMCLYKVTERPDGAGSHEVHEDVWEPADVAFGEDVTINLRDYRLTYDGLEKRAERPRTLVVPTKHWPNLVVRTADVSNPRERGETAIWDYLNDDVLARYTEEQLEVSNLKGKLHQDEHGRWRVKNWYKWNYGFAGLKTYY